MLELEIEVDDNDLILSSTSSKGNQMKWYKDGFWLKANRWGYEGIAECATSIVLSCSNLFKEMYVEYLPCKIIDGTEVYSGCASKDFKPSGWSVITLHRIFEKFNVDQTPLTSSRYTTRDRVKYVVDAVNRCIDVDISSYLSVLLTLDAFILNEDRHFNNIALLYKDGLYDWAPIFDNGLSLLSDLTAYPTHVPLDVNMRKVKAKTFNSSFTKQLDAVGVGFHIDGELLTEKLEWYRSDLGRAYDVLKRQIERYKGLIVV
jgi:hypothetical protein